ncbi:stage II sporulation protein M [Oryzifoliimicrobium ureilyticus]|uniref:stage II sporulation protein M n=1 Tax=Oryzifoliimicrobium ureilyticus TaxID=3113724 RepID=UPI003076451A
MSAEGDLIRSSRFRAEREPGWRRLAAIVDTVEKGGFSSLAFEDARDLVMLYRQAVNSLSVARAISLDAGVVAFLESLCARAYLVVYAPRQSLRGIVWRFISVGAPQAVRRSFVAILASFAFLAFGVAIAYALTNSDPEWFYAFVPAGLAGGRGPAATAESLRAGLYDRDADISQLSSFAAYLFSHNTSVSITMFALGVIVCVPGALLIIFNGATVGAFAAVFADKGLLPDLLAWLSIHGVTELTAFVLSGAGGLRLGFAVLFPGLRSRGGALREAAVDATKLAVLAALMLVVAGLLEGVGRQVVTDFWARIAIGWGMGAMWFAWFMFGGRNIVPPYDRPGALQRNG